MNEQGDPLRSATLSKVPEAPATRGAPYDWRSLALGPWLLLPRPASAAGRGQVYVPESLAGKPAAPFRPESLV